MPIELRPVPGFEGLYSASSDGRIWSEPRFAARQNGVPMTVRGRWLKASPDSIGYPFVTLCKEGREHRMRAHRVIALAWHPNPGALPWVNHLNGVKTDIRPANLEWCTPSQNNAHAYRTGLKVKSARQMANASRAGKASRVLTLDQAADVRRLVASGQRQIEVAKRFGIALMTVNCIVRGKTYLNP